MTTSIESVYADAHALGRTVLSVHAASVDAEARFPSESFAALKAARLLSAYVPEELGGMGLSAREIAKVCEIFGNYCANTAMVFAMHQIQVACIRHHTLHSPTFRDILRELSERQLLLASATTEIGTGGDVRSSICAVITEGGRYHLEKQAPVISYADEADAILITARRAPDAGPHDQVHVFARREHCALTPLSNWDTLGFRGTCSIGYKVVASGPADLVLPAPYAEIHAKSMHGFAHGTWGSLWLGLANDALNRARAFVRAEARKTPGNLPPGALRLAEADTTLFAFRSMVENTVAEYDARLSASGDEPFATDYGFTLRLNNLKVKSSELVVQVVSEAMMICGIHGYRNDSKHSVARHLRDAYGAALMVNNDRILGQSANVQILQREG